MFSSKRWCDEERDQGGALGLPWESKLQIQRWSLLLQLRRPVHLVNWDAVPGRLRQWDQLCPDEAGGFTGTHRATSPWLIVYRSAAVLHAWVCAEADRSMMLQKSIMHVLTQWWMIIANKQKNVKCLCFFEFSTIIPMFFYVISLSHPMPSACPPGPTTISPPLHPGKCVKPHVHVTIW